MCVCLFCVITAAPTAAAATTTATIGGDHDNQQWRQQQRQQQQHSVSVTLPIEQYHLVEWLLQLELFVAGPVEQSVPAALAHQQRKRTPPSDDDRESSADLVRVL